MVCPKCNFEQDDHNIECARCGIVFSKLKRNVSDPLTPLSEKPVEQAVNHHPRNKLKDFDFWSIFKDICFYTRPQFNVFIFAGYAIVFVLTIIWGIKFILHPLPSTYPMQSFWHMVNLPFHEAGHVIFRLFGRFITSLGGSLGQLLMPLVCLGVFLLKTRDTFAASFCLWWFGQNFVDLAPYINDARSLTLPLIGGNTGRTSPYGFHDWEFILRESGLINYDHVIANLSHYGGVLIMIWAYMWGAYLLFKQYHSKDM